MSSTPTPDPGAAEQLRRQFTAAVSQMWTNEWSQRSAGDGYRWFRHAWRDTRRILEQTPPIADERIEQYAARLRAQLQAIQWQYAYDDPDDDGYVDEDSWYAGVMHTIIGILNRMELDIREAQLFYRCVQ
ncbi:MAG: hypothetical protein ACLFVO_16750 [Chloroflexaceae bacterium]